MTGWQYDLNVWPSCSKTALTLCRSEPAESSAASKRRGYFPGIVKLWSSGTVCPLRARGHSILEQCGSEVFSLDDFFASLQEATLLERPGHALGGGGARRLVGRPRVRAGRAGRDGAVRRGLHRPVDGHLQGAGRDGGRAHAVMAALPDTPASSRRTAGAGCRRAARPRPTCSGGPASAIPAWSRSSSPSTCCSTSRWARAGPSA